MTTGGSQADNRGEKITVVLSNNPSRAQHIEHVLHDEPVFQKHTVIILPVKDTYDPHSSAPEMIVLDDENGSVDPLQWIKKARLTCPNSAIILIAPKNDPLLASRALRAGANAFMTSDECDHNLPTALSMVARGERYVSEDVMQGILHGMSQTADEDSSIPVEALSDREMMVFQLLGEGKVIQNIAHELHVNIKTVATHCNNIRRKLGAADNHQLFELSREWASENNEAASSTQDLSS